MKPIKIEINSATERRGYDVQVGNKEYWVEYVVGAFNELDGWHFYKDSDEAYLPEKLENAILRKIKEVDECKRRW